MTTTCHSDTGKIKSIFIKKVEQAFISKEHIQKHWKELNYLDEPRLEYAIAEYANFESIIQQQGATVFHLPEDSLVNMDSLYCRDSSIATNGGMIICNMGKPARSKEPAVVKKAFEAAGIKILGTITAPGTLEAGDVAWLDENTLAVGHTYRTNPAVIEQLKTLLQPLSVEVITVPMPHYKGPSDVFHLMSVLSPVDTNLAVVYSPLLPIVFRNLLLEKGYQLVEVPHAEFESMGCNVLALAPRQCLMAAGNPVTTAALQAAGCTVTLYKGEEISVKGGGGPTCLTRPVERYR